MTLRALVRQGLAAVVATAVMVVAGAGAVSAAGDTVGVNGVGLRLELPTADDGRPVLNLAHASRLNVTVSNSADESRSVRVYTVAVAEQNGTFALGPDTSAGWVELDSGEVRLEPGERTKLSAPVDRHRVPDEVAYAAAVVERGTGTTVVARAASVFHVRGQDAVAGLDGPIAISVLLMGAVLLGHLLRVRGRVEGFLTGS